MSKTTPVRQLTDHEKEDPLTYAELLEALSRLTPEQLSQPVSVFDGDESVHEIEGLFENLSGEGPTSEDLSPWDQENLPEYLPAGRIFLA